MTTTRQILNDRHRDELRASGLSDATIEKSGIYSVENGEISKLLRWKSNEFVWNGGYAIPYLHTDDYVRVKPDWPRPGAKDKPCKYESPKGESNRAYFGLQPSVPPTGTTIIITEGEKKCLAIQQAGHHCIGLSGVWNWQAKRMRTETGKGYGKRELIDDLSAIDWHREVVVCFDSDAVTNSSVRLAECRLSETLAALGASVRIARIPADGDAKVGADDFLITRGVEEFQKLLDNADEAEKPPALSSMDLARLYVEEFYTQPEGVTLRAYRDQLYVYDDTHYVVTPESEMQAVVLDWQDRIMAGVKPRQAADTVKALHAACRVPFNIDMPTLICASGYAKPNWLAFSNGILDLDAALANESAKLRPNTPQWFSQFSLPHPFDPAATCESWYTTLSEIFDNGDKEHVVECVNALGEFFGYTITSDTSQHRMLFLEGPRRTGKSTVLKILEAVVGEANIATPTLSSLAGQFGLWPLVGKKLAIFGDAHLPRGDRGIATLERLKSISGEDAQNVERKFLPTLNGIRLPVRFALACNELPKFGDNANALASRLLILPFRNSFLGREDRERESKLLAELPGILNWALDGLRRLRQSGGFTVPIASQQILDQFERLTSPAKAFIEDCFVLGNGEEFVVSRDAIWDKWKEYSEASNLDRGTKSSLGVALRSIVSGFGDIQKRESGGRVRYYTGLRFKTIADDQ